VGHGGAGHHHARLPLLQVSQQHTTHRAREGHGLQTLSIGYLGETRGRFCAGRLMGSGASMSAFSPNSPNF
jgi:hypothetical protein